MKMEFLQISLNFGENNFAETVTLLISSHMNWEGWNRSTLFRIVATDYMQLFIFLKFNVNKIKCSVS